MYAGMQQYLARPGGISRGGAHFFGRHHQSMHEHGHLASLGDRPMLAASPSVFGPALHRGLLNGRSPPPETLRRYQLGLHDDRSLLRGHEHGSSPSDRTIELGLVGYGATAPSSTNPTPSRVRGQPPGEDSYSAEYGPLRQHEGAQLAVRRPSIYGSTASASMADLPPRTLEESFLRHGAIPPSLPAGYTSDAPGIPTYGRYDSTHRSVHSYLPAGEGEEEEEEMPPLPPLPTARRKAQPRQEETQAFQGEDRHDRGARPFMRANRPDPINIVPQELAMGHEMFHLPRPLGMASDSRYLTEFHCFLRSNLIEVFCATKEDMATAPSSTNPTPSRVRGQPPGEDSYSAEYGPLRQHEGAQLAVRRPSIYGSTASASMADLPPRTLEESFLRHGAIPPSLPAGYTSDAPGIPTYGRYDSTHRSVHSYLPAGEGEEEEEEMPPLPPLPTARRKAQPRQEETQAFQGEDRHDRGARPFMRANRPDPINIVPQELAMGHEMFHLPRPLGMASDSRYLTEFHCFLRSNLIEVFCATKEDMNGKILIVLRDRSLQIFTSSYLISTVRRRISLTENQFSHLFFIHSLAPRRGRKKPVLLGQVGVRCMSCAVAARGSGTTGKQNHGASYYPTTIGSIYNSVMLIQQRHFSECKSISTEARAEYSRLKQILGRSGAAKDYWEDSARKMGLIDTPEGIRHQPTSPSTSVSASNAGHASASLTSHARNDGIEPAQSLVRLGDKDLATKYAFFIMQQMSPCTFTENDRLGKRRSHRCGFPGIACVHCVDKNGSGRYFPSSVKTFADASKTINVLHNHILKCSGAPEAVKNQLQQLKEAHQAEKDGMKHGSQKQFFDLVWSRLHNTSGSPSSVVSTSPHTNPSVSGVSPDACSFGSYGDSTTVSSSTLAVSPADTTAASFAGANPRKVDSSISDVALIMLEMKSPVVWAAESDQVQQVASI